MSATNLRDLAHAWLERNASRNTLRNATGKHVFQGASSPPPQGTPQAYDAHSEAASVPLFHPIGRGTVERGAAELSGMERPLKHFAEQHETPPSEWPPDWLDAFIADTARTPEGARAIDWRGACLGAKRFGDAYARALALCGWSYAELFRAPEYWGRLDQRGAAFFVRARPVLDITGDAITYQADDRHRLTVRRRAAPKAC